MCHVYVSTDGLSAVAISDKDYPQRVAFNMLNKVHEFILLFNNPSYSAEFLTEKCALIV